MKWIKLFENFNDLIEVKPNKYLYHTSNPIFRGKISKEGLVPKGKSESWLSDTKIDGKVIFAINSHKKEDVWNSGYDDDLYRIDTTNLKNKWYRDPNFVSGIYANKNNKAIITFEPIPLNSIDLVYKGSGKSLDDLEKNYYQMINESNTQNLEKLADDFINHFINNTGLDINNIPKEILNKFPDFSTNPISYKSRLDDNDKIYAGSKSNKDINNKKSWTLDEETALAFSKKHENSIIFELTIDEFINKFNYFVSMDVIYDYLMKKGVYNKKLNKYFSESEILVLDNKLNESINIENPQTDEYNDIFVDGEKVGYIILAPARKEYYWVDINLPNPLAIVEIKIFNQFRGKNYMKETMNWLYDFSKENGFKSLFLRVDDDSEISQETLYQIYAKLGFSTYRTIDSEDDIFMYKML